MYPIKLYNRLFLTIVLLSMALVMAIVTFGLVPTPPARAAAILYVKPGGWGDCTSWAKACLLQTALSLAASGDEIWVAAGVYKPAVTVDRNATIWLQNGVALYGGFAGTETSRDQRDWTANVTVLSGDLEGNDLTDDDGVITTTAHIVGSNSYHVVTGSGTNATAVLDGFTITGGQADGPLFSSNDRGGGLYNDGGSPTLSHLIFSGNLAGAWGGGGLENINSSHPLLLNVIFRNNSTSEFGGGVDNSYGSNPTLVNVIFSGNRADEGGGAMMNYVNCQPTLINVTFYGNSATQGGGMLNYSGGPATLINAILWGNQASVGPQIYIYASPSILGYSLVQGGCPAGATCDHVIDVDPQFVDSAHGDLRLQATSPAIDAGDNDAVPAGITIDVDSYPRFVDNPNVADTGHGSSPLVDMGACEEQSGATGPSIYLPVVVKDH